MSFRRYDAYRGHVRRVAARQSADPSERLQILGEETCQHRERHLVLLLSSLEGMSCDSQDGKGQYSADP